MSTLIKILHLEETNSDSELIKRELKKGNLDFEYLWVNNKLAFEKQLINFSPNVILSEYSLPFFSCREALAIAKNTDLAVPFILVTGSATEDMCLDMTKLGVVDYLFKTSLKRLPNAIVNIIARSNTERKLLVQNEEVKGNERRFKTVIENISDGILLLDAKGKIFYQSPSAEKITGFSYSQALGKSLFEFAHPSDLEAITRYFKQTILKPGVAIENSYRILRNKGRFIWVEGTITNLLHDVNINAIVVNFRDITQRKIAEDRMEKSEANLRTIFDNTDISYVLADKLLRVISFNTAAQATYRKEFKVELKDGDSLLDYLYEDRKPQSRARFEKALRGEKVSYELNFAQASGNTAWYNVNMFPVRDDMNNLLGLIVASENITDRKRIELERNKMLSDILQHNKDLEQFAYIISHNLRSPVANILGLSALLENSPDMDKESFDKCMNGLTLSVKKLDEVIVDLNYILQTRREINEKKESISFSELINDIKTSISSLIEKENITINTNFTVNKFFTLKSYIYSIFFNLIYNSIKYRNPALNTVIDVQSKKINNKLVIEIRDNGLGIDLKAHGKTIFGLYKKFHKHIEGKGMGLYMVKTQVEILGGKIRVASEVNMGTTFVIEFEE